MHHARLRKEAGSFCKKVLYFFKIRATIGIENKGSTVQFSKSLRRKRSAEGE